MTGDEPSAVDPQYEANIARSLLAKDALDEGVTWQTRVICPWKGCEVGNASATRSGSVVWVPRLRKTLRQVTEGMAADEALEHRLEWALIVDPNMPTDDRLYGSCTHGMAFITAADARRCVSNKYTKLTALRDSM
jgi:hypothetical protein